MNKNILFPIISIVGAIVLLIVANMPRSSHDSMISSSGSKSGQYKVNDREAPEGYRTITAIDGVSFHVTQTAADTATAVSQISDNVAFDTDSYYSFKNGTDRYLLFNVSELVVAAQKGTNFDFATNGLTENALKASSVTGIWFDKSGKKISGDEKNGTYTLQANGGVVITKEIYGNYAGKLKVITDGEEEWSIFAGVEADTYKDVSKEDRKIIDTIVESIHFAEHKEAPKEIYAVSLGAKEDDVAAGTPQKPTEAATTLPATTKPSETEDTPDVVEEIPQKEPGEDSSISEEIMESDEKDAEDTPEPETENDEKGGEPKPEDEAEKVEESLPEQDNEESSPSENTVGEEKDKPAETDFTKVTATQDDSTQERGASLKLTNQKRVERSADNAYTSDIYSMLDIGDSAIYAVYDIDRKSDETPIINIASLLTGKEAEAVIRSYCMKPDAAYEFFAPPNGCSWHAVKYSLNYKKCTSTPYTDIRLRGLDGGTLVQRGVKYSSRTHDIHSFIIEQPDGWIDNYYCYYAVPNGCTEYVLEIGGPVADNTQVGTAFYRIKSVK